MARMTKAQKAIEDRVEKAFHTSRQCIQIPMLKVPVIFKHCRTVIADKPDISQDELEAAIKAYVDTIRVN